MRGSIAGAGLALALVGCGYEFVRYRGAFAEELGSVAIRTPENDSSEPGVEYLVADALRRECLRRGGLRLEGDPGAADVVVSGRVRPLKTERSAISSVLLALEYEVTLDLELAAARRRAEAGEGAPLRLVESERYLASADLEATRKNRQEALRRISQVLATRFYDALYEDLKR